MIPMRCNLRPYKQPLNLNCFWQLTHRKPLHMPADILQPLPSAATHRSRKLPRKQNPEDPANRMREPRHLIHERLIHETAYPRHSTAILFHQVIRAKLSWCVGTRGVEDVLHNQGQSALLQQCVGLPHWSQCDPIILAAHSSWALSTSDLAWVFDERLYQDARYMKP